MKSPRSQNPFLLVLLIVSLLGLLSLLQPGLTVGGVALRPVRLLADVLRPNPAAGSESLPPPNGPAGPADSVLTAQATPPPDSAEVAAVAKAPAVANVGGLDNFLAALRQTKADGSPVRIAYFGDSMIEGDLITSDLRNSLQVAFGGSGVGYVPIHTVAADFRETIHETASANWQEYNLVSPKLPAGVSAGHFGPRVRAPRGNGGGRQRRCAGRELGAVPDRPAVCAGAALCAGAAVLRPRRGAGPGAGHHRRPRRGARARRHGHS